MSNSNRRKVKSLNDIPEVFQKRGPVDIPLTNVASEHFVKLNETKGDEFPSKGISVKLEDLDESDLCDVRKSVADSGNGEANTNEAYELEKTQVSQENVDEQLKNSKVDPFEAISFLSPLSEQEEERNSRKKWKKQKRILTIVDILLAFTVMTPMTVGFWRGTWTLMDFHANMFPGAFTFFLGISVHTIFAVLRNLLHVRVMNAMKKKSLTNKLLWKSMQILYTYVFGVACNMHWRGGWIIFDHFFYHRIWAFLGATVMAMIILTIFRSIRNLIAVPMIVLVDQLSYVFHFPTRYKMNTRDWSLYLLDCAFSVGVVGTLVVFVWRGVWILFDLYLFPEDRKYSAIGSLAIGYVIVTVTFSLQPLMRYVCARLQGLARVVAADGFLLLSFLGTVNVWRGIWNVLDLWLVPDNPELSCWITHVGCFVFLVLLNCSNSILVRGVYIDAEEDDGKCVVFPCHYLRLFFKVEREKKEARRRNLLVASKDFRPRPDVNTKDTENGALLPNSTGTTILPTNPESLV